MEWAVWTASSDSEDATTEIDEEGAPSNIGQQGSFCEVAVHSSANNAQASIDLAFVNKAASTGDGWYSRESVKAEAEEKPPCKVVQDLIHFEYKDGSTVPVPHGIRSKLSENISEEDGISYSESEDLTTQMSKDDEQELVTEEDLGETAEELEFYNFSSEFGDSWRGSEVQRKKRNFTEDEQGQASKLAEISEHPQKKQIPCENTESGESASNPTLCQWSDSFQARPLEDNYAAEEPINCTQTTESFCHSSLLLKRQEVATEDMMYTCPDCNITCKNSSRLNRHRVIVHKIEISYKCPDCNKPFVTADGMSEHRRARHNVEKSFQCSKCNTKFSSSLHLKEHWKERHAWRTFKCPKCSKVFSSPGSLGDHQIAIHKTKKAFQCTDCSVKLHSLARLKKHQTSVHRKKAIESNKPISNPDTLLNNQVAVHNAENLFQCMYCNLKFSSSWLLNGHLLTHINVLRMQLNIQQVITFCPPSSHGPWFGLPL